MDVELLLWFLIQIYQLVDECIEWFSEVSYWSQTNYILQLLQLCSGRLLKSIFNHISQSKQTLATRRNAAHGEFKVFKD